MNVRNFRANLKNCLDQAENGATVYIDRYGTTFALQLTEPGALCKHGYSLENRMCKYGCK